MGWKSRCISPNSPTCKSCPAWQQEDGGKTCRKTCTRKVGKYTYTSAWNHHSLTRLMRKYYLGSGLWAMFWLCVIYFTSVKTSFLTRTCSPTKSRSRKGRALIQPPAYGAIGLATSSKWHFVCDATIPGCIRNNHDWRKNILGTAVIPISDIIVNKSNELFCLFGCCACACIWSGAKQSWILTPLLLQSRPLLLWCLINCELWGLAR